MRRYEMWSATGAELSAVAQAPRKASYSAHSALHRVPELDDFQTSAMIYGYGLPVDLVIDAAAKIDEGSPFRCKTSRISSKRIDLTVSDESATPDRSMIGSPTSLRIDELGEVSGRVAGTFDAGFQFSVDESYRPALVEKLSAAVVKRGLNSKVSIAGGDTIKRLELKNKNCEFIGPDGRPKSGRILNLSQVDVLIQAISPPKAPSIVVFHGAKKYAAEVTSTFVLGFVARFSWQISDQDFSEDMRFDIG